MLLNTEGLVIKTIKYGDTSIITHIFTKGKGLKTFIVNGVRIKKATLPLGLFQPGTYLEINMYAHDQKKILRLKEARIASPWKNLPFDIKRSSISLFICELLEKTLKESDEHEQLFLDVLDYFKWIDSSQESLANIPVMFLILLSGHFGFLPQGNFTESERFFDLQEGYYTSKPISSYYMSVENSQQFSKYLNSDLNSSSSISVNRTIRRSIMDDLLKYYSLHIENFPTIRSLNIFHSIMEI